MSIELKFIGERMVIDFAKAIAEAEGKITLDEALPVLATPAVLIDFKSEEESDLKLVMRAVRQFIKRNKRLINFSKDAITKALREEWIPTLDDDEKAIMLSDYKIFEGIDENGFILYNPKLYDAFVKVTKPDNHKYGTMPYEPKVARKHGSAKPKLLLDTVQPDAELSVKLQPFIQWYKQHYAHIVELESYKWTATKTFQDNFDIDAPDIYSNLKRSLKDETNLLSGNYNFSKDVLLKNAKYSPEEIRFALRHLFDESVIIAERVPKFIEVFNDIHSVNQASGNIRMNEKPNQNDHSVSVLLSFKYPSKHFIYKYSIWYEVVDTIGLNYPRLSAYTHTLHAYDQICQQIRRVLLAYGELVALHDNAYSSDLSDYHLLTQDFIYAIGSHFQGFDKPPRH